MDRRVRCHVCNARGQLRQFPYLRDNENRRHVAIFRRNNNGLENLNYDENRGHCLNCNKSFANELAAIEADPTFLRINVINQRGNRSCPLCNAEDNVQRILLECRVNIFVVGMFPTT